MSATPSMVMIHRPYLAELAKEAARVTDPEDAQFLNESLQYAARALEGNAPDIPAQPAEPPLPPGEYARVEIMGHDSVTGWVSDGTRAGVPVMVVRDWDGRVLREVPGQSLYQFFPLATPLRRPEPELAALPAAASRPYIDPDSNPWAGEDDEDPGEIDLGPVF